MKSGFTQVGKQLGHAADVTVEATKSGAKTTLAATEKAADAAKPYAKQGLHAAAVGTAYAAPVVAVVNPAAGAGVAAASKGLHEADKVVNPEMQKKKLLEQLYEHHYARELELGQDWGYLYDMRKFGSGSG